MSINQPITINHNQNHELAFRAIHHPRRKPDEKEIAVSHFTTIKTQIKDLKALRAACQELGLALVPNAQARGYNDNQIKAEQVIRLKGPYDIALNQQKDGSFGFTADFWDGHVEKEVGPNYGKLIQLYGVHKATIEARKKGHLVKRASLADGSIKLVIAGVGA